MTETPKPERNREKVPAKNLFNLVEKTDVQHVSEALGYSFSAINVMIREGVCVKVVEIAAGALLHESRKDKILIVRCPNEKLSAFTEITKALALSVTEMKA
ncbi:MULTISPECIES: hypothetical protein [unclassified Roseobacter]|uniref:hypothetical protein n=1 Tax=unclassified Roseobacter TaxID=196798 RepID=UPI001492FF78|nr:MULTISPECIES: hypothetical protein [unclassified Roseobacter]NNW55465.1 hypothetical protein [Roseobacter sp. HKCCD8284]NNY17294.1 hypothetical protein [Roseobacter sp. HKCCD8191]